MQPIHLIVNPVAAGGRGARRAEVYRAALERAGYAPVTSRSSERGEAVRLAREAAESGAGLVIAAGGDGTAHDVANGLLEATSPVPVLALIPIGTGNDFAQAVGAATSPAALVAAIRRADARDVDVGRVRWDGRSEYFVNAMGLGIDVEVVRQIERLPSLPGFVGYLVGLLRALRRYRPIPVELETDGGTTSARIMMLAVTNGHRIGGGFHVSPDADPADGQLDICLVRELGALGIAGTIPRVLRGTHAGARGVSLGRAGMLRIRAVGERPFCFQVDGELRDSGDASTLEVQVLPGALRVLGSGAAA